MPNALPRFRLVLLLAAGWAGMVSIALRADQPFVTGLQGFGSIENYQTGFFGLTYANVTGTPVTITQLGRYVLPGNSQVHTLAIYSTTTPPVVVASVTINLAGATPGQFVYAKLATPYVVPVGQEVCIVSSEITGGDTYYNNNNTGISVADISSPYDQAVYLPNGSYIFRAGNNGFTHTSVGPVSFQFSSPTHQWSKSGTVYTLKDAEVYTVNSAIADANDGDTINLPAVSATWGATGSSIVIPKAVAVIGAGAGNTVINIPTSAPTYSSGGAVVITGPAIFGNLTMKQPGGANTTAIKATGSNGWRITGVTYQSATQAGYFVYADTYGLIDNCTINGGNGGDEWIFTRGPSNSWQTPSSMGTANAVYVEDCTFNKQGYPDFNSNARAVVRFCTINPTVNNIKIDAHGYTTNSPPRSARHVEIYDNTWTVPGGNALGIELRGGTGMIFDNLQINPNTTILLTDYGYLTNLTNYGRYETPLDYPLIDQIGVGVDPKSGGSEPLYMWNNFAPSAPTLWGRSARQIGSASAFTTDGTAYPVGSTAITLANITSSGSGNGFVGTGDAVAFGGDAHRYLVTAGLAPNSAFPATITLAPPGLQQAISASAVQMISGPQTLYQQQVGDPAAIFTEADVIKPDRDFYTQSGTAADGVSTGVARGLKSTMLGLSPTKVGVGFWVTNEGSWNTLLPPNTSGQLYTWNGSSWVLKYTPYTYPHPLRSTLIAAPPVAVLPNNVKVSITVH